MKNENLLLFENLPVTDEPVRKKKSFRNCLFMQINRLMNHFKVEPKDVRIATGIPKGTLSEWTNASVEIQKLDDNIKKLATYFGVSVDYLAYGTPMSDKDVELDDLMDDFLDVTNH